AALISSEGSLDWLCFPRFDSPAIFLRLLDEEKGGYCLVQPAGAFTSTRSYDQDSAVLRTVFRCDGGTMTLTDFMPVRRSEKAGPQGRGVDAVAMRRVVRLVRCHGELDCRLEVKVTPDYAQRPAKLVRRGDHRVLAVNPRDNLHIQLPSGYMIDEHGVIRSTVRMRDGDQFAVVLSWSEPDKDVGDMNLDVARKYLRQTLDYWEHWSRDLRYRGDHAEMVKRSAVTLKLLTYEPTGAIVAAPTTSLPEQLGGKRNWDYRYTWLRDSSLTLAALMNIGKFAEAHDFFHFLHESLPRNAADFRIMYEIDGGQELTETDLPLSGYRGSRPVRLGNGAAGQTQLDIYGELMHCMYLYFSHPDLSRADEPFENEFWPLVQSTADFVAAKWLEPGSGMWEMRGKKQQFVHSVAMCWVALDRAIKLARQFRIPHDLSRWENEQRRIIEAIETRGFHPSQRAYVQFFDGQAMDASILRLPVMGVVDARSERFASTVVALENRLMNRGLLYRYTQDETDDGVGGNEGTFTACGFWLVESYVLQGRLSDAERLFERLIGHANDVGLLSEEIEPHTGEQLGNFPQGFTHIGLVNAACRIAAAKGLASGVTQEMLQGDGSGDRAA
ncbi:MAG: glycoside hydrolase family 15 protein, partial [Terriglobales bacterium]